MHGSVVVKVLLIACKQRKAAAFSQRSWVAGSSGTEFQHPGLASSDLVMIHVYLCAWTEARGEVERTLALGGYKEVVLW